MELLTTTKSDKWDVSPKQIIFEDEIGEGAFGSVYSATVNNKADVIKAYYREHNKGIMKNKFAVKVLKGKMNCSSFIMLIDYFVASFN